MACMLLPVPAQAVLVFSIYLSLQLPSVACVIQSSGPLTAWQGAVRQWLEILLQALSG